MAITKADLFRQIIVRGDVSSSSFDISGSGASGGMITGLRTPTADLDAVNKSYVDAISAGFGGHLAVILRSTGDLAATYDNGTSGVGATLTSNTNEDINSETNLDQDSGYTIVSGDRILVMNQTTDSENGIYEVTTVGDGSNAWVLTRTSDFDNSPSSEIMPGDFFPVQSGDSYAGYQYYQVAFDGSSDTIGTDSITFTQFSSPTDLTAGNGIDITSNVITVDLAATSGLEFDGGDLRIAAQGNGLTGGGGSLLAVQADGNTISVGASGISVNASAHFDTTTNLSIATSAIGETELNNVDGGVDAESFVITSNYGSNGSNGSVTSGDTIEDAIKKLEGQLGASTLSALTDTDISTPASGHVLIWDGTDSWDNKAVSGAITIADDGTTTLGTDVVNTTHIDWGSSADQVNATSVLLNTGGTYGGSASNVQDALEELETSAVAFGTIQVGGQDSVIADVISDTLTLTAGTNVTITTNAGADSITISSTDTTYTAGNGIDITSEEISIDLLDAASGLTFAGTGSDELTIDWGTSGDKAVKASVLASTSNGEGASLIGIEDSGGLITATTVEGALAELAGNVNVTRVIGETPSGDLDGVDTTYTLANTPATWLGSSAVAVYLNGIRQKGSGEDYSITTNTITFTNAPLAGDVILVDYVY